MRKEREGRYARRWARSSGEASLGGHYRVHCHCHSHTQAPARVRTLEEGACSPVHCARVLSARGRANQGSILAGVQAWG